MKTRGVCPAVRALICFVVCLQAMGGGFKAEAAERYACPSRYEYIIFLVDVSASMDMRHKSLGVNKLSLAKQVLLRINDSIRLEDARHMPSALRGVVVQTFPYKMAAPLQPYDPDALAASFAALGRNHEEFPRLTNISDAITRQFAAIPKQYASIRLVLVSDGENNRGEAPSAVVRTLQKQNSGLDVQIISLADTPEGEETLKRIVDVIPGPNRMERAEDLLDNPEKLMEVAHAFCWYRACYFNDIHFALGSFAITHESAWRLQDIASWVMKGDPQWTIEICGHTDNKGSERANRLLSERRAQAAKDYFISIGVPANRILTRGYGSGMPKYNNSTEDGRRMNRRVELDFPLGRYVK